MNKVNLNDQKCILALNKRIELWIEKCLQNQIDPKSIQQQIDRHLKSQLTQSQVQNQLKKFIHLFLIVTFVCLMLFTITTKCEIVCDLMKTIGRICLIKVDLI